MFLICAGLIGEHDILVFSDGSDGTFMRSGKTLRYSQVWSPEWTDWDV